MVLRSAGEIGCAHCATFGAERECASCARLVCAACSTNWASCTEPTGRIVRLGIGARVRDIDPSGRLALVSHWRQPLRVFELRQLRWMADITLPRQLWTWSRANPPCLTSTGMLVHANLGREASEYQYRGLTWRSLDGAQSTDLATPMPWQAMQVSGRDRLFYVDSSDHVIVVSADAPRTLGVAPAARPVHSAFLDEDRGLVVTGGPSSIALHRLNAQLDLVWRQPTEDQGLVTSVALAGKALVVGVRRPDGVIAYELRWLDASLTPGPLAHRIVPDSPVRATAISRDGRHFAIGTDDGLTVYDLDARSSMPLDDHSDCITCVRFASDDHLLISADSDNRVILRPRTASGYVVPLVRVEAT